MDFFVNGKGAFLVIVQLHGGRIETSFAFNEIAVGGVFDDHF